MNIFDFINLIQQSEKKIAVYGDLLLDVYESVKATRLSPEFPISVMNLQNKRVIRPGGAGNVCEQFKHFPTKVSLFSFIDDETYKAINIGNFDIATCLKCECHIPQKKRFYDHHFPLCRIDDELPNYGINNPEETRKVLLGKFIHWAQQHNPDVVVFSDYNKGVLTPSLVKELLNFCHESGIKTVIDPKKNLWQWRNCTVFKPNLTEAAYFLQIEPSELVASWEDSLKTLKKKTNAKGVLITNEGNGVFGISENDETFWYNPNYTSELRSVIGAGDCYAAVLSLAIAHDFPLREAAQIAYEAGSVYVHRIHNEPIFPHELLSQIDPIRSKIITDHQYLKKICDYNKNKMITLANGAFDAGMTANHIHCLEFARKQGDILIVALNDDNSVARLKGAGRPIMPLEERMIVLAGLRSVNYVTCFSEDTPLELIKYLGVNVVVKGSEYKPEDVAGFGIAEVRLFPYINNTMTTTDKIRKLQRNAC